LRPQDITYPALLDFPAPTLSGYPRETVVAEKFQAMVYLRTLNSRMKDFYDVWLLAKQFAFDGEVLAKAIAATFENRKTAIDVAPIAFTPDFTEQASTLTQWTAFQRSSRTPTARRRSPRSCSCLSNSCCPSRAPLSAATVSKGAGRRAVRGPAEYEPQQATTAPTARGAVTRKAYSTTTRTSEDTLVPWLAAEGPLAYTPELPPARDSLFQYGWVLPQVCKPGLRRHVYFGALRREDAHDVFAFWQDARRGAVARVAHHEGRLAGGTVEAPVAVYRHNARRGDRGYLFIQHGSYQCVPVDEQPELEAGYVHLHRGIGDAKVFRLWGYSRTGADSRYTSTWEKYARLQFDVLSRADLSFNSIHDRAKRAETGHIRDDTWMTDQLATERGLDIERDPWTRALWKAAHQSFALRRWVSEHKFGPHRVVCRTPLTNIRITTFFAGEHEVRVLDPSRVELLAAIGCEVNVES
jgi:hypothetical protein